jgi:hypothetical protein
MIKTAHEATDAGMNFLLLLYFDNTDCHSLFWRHIVGFGFLDILGYRLP